MTDRAALRQALASFLGDAQYRKFIRQGAHRGRLRYWQERAWDEFVAIYPAFAVDPAERAAALRVCHLHGDDLLPDTAEVFRGCRDLTQQYTDARGRLFPNAALDAVSTEGRPFVGDRIGVWFCPSCRAAAAEWRARRR